MPRELRLAIAQVESPAGCVEVAFDQVARMLNSAAAAGAQMVVLPELFLPGYNSDRIAELAQPADGSWMARLCAMVRVAKCGLTVGFAERDGACLYNSAVAIAADGRVLACYRKVQLYGPREARLFEPGDEFVTFDLAGRRLALLICYDVEFAGHIRVLSQAGVDLILVPTANMVPYTYVSDHVVPALSATHGITIAYVNYCGVEGNLTYCGGSTVTGQDGAVLVKAGMHAALLMVDLPARLDPRVVATHLADFRAVTKLRSS